MKSAIQLYLMDGWFEDGYRGLAEPARILDSLGVDILTLPEHLAMANNIEQFERRYGKSPVGPQSTFIEPMVQLAWLAGVTKSIRLGAGILLAPLRPSLLLAKQISSLDCLSGGRAWMGLGAGWQKEEFDACNIPWKGRYDLVVEQVKACRALWGQAPASFHGEFISFDDLNMRPLPPQGKDLAVILGIKGTAANFQRMADCGAGWIPMNVNLQELAEPIRAFRRAHEAAGRNPDDLEVATYTNIVQDEHGDVDLDRTLALAPRYAEIGVTTLIYAPPAFCDGMKAFGAFAEKVQRAVKG